MSPERLLSEPSDVSATAVELPPAGAYGPEGLLARRAVSALRVDPDPDKPSELTNWLLTEAPKVPPEELMDAFAAALRRSGIPVDRLMIAIESLHSVAMGVSRVWTAEKGVEERPFPHGARDSELYRGSPFFAAHRNNEWLVLDIAADHERFNVLPELMAEGLRHYLCIPILFTGDRRNGLAIATRDPDGFPPAALETLRRAMPAFTAVLELSVERWRLVTTLGTYVGRTPARRILSGTVRRGEIERIEAAIMFVDMRDFTAITAEMTPEDTVELLDAYFDCLVPNIRGHGGEVLKFLGDGVLATFRVDPEAPETYAAPMDMQIGSRRSAARAVAGALGAAHASLHAMEALNSRAEIAGVQERGMEAGFALHFGEAAFGNVGAEDRLDFTVVGRDVNLASRVARLNRTLNEPILLSEEAARHLRTDSVSMGSHALPGLDAPVEVFRPAG